jgi:DNA mismatch repair protein MutS
VNRHQPQPPLTAGQTDAATTLGVEQLASAQSRATATPMMEQFIEIKTANPDSLLFYRMGDFYELFFRDAEIASRALGITLTKRGQHLGQDIPMCGVPVHAADDYLQRLIGLGHRVAVCEQTEDPAEAKKRGAKSVVRRDVVRLVTPGTITEEKLLDPSEQNWLMTLARLRGSGGAGEFALAWIDISTGAFRVMTSSFERLASDIARIDPREIVMADAVLDDSDIRSALVGLRGALRAEPASQFDSAAAPERVSRHYGVKTTDAFGDFSRAELAAIAAAIAYVEKTQIGVMPPLQRPERETTGSTLFIDQATRTNLELTRTLSGERKGSLLKAMDRTVTGVGARLLASRLTAPLTDPAMINQRLDSVAAFMADSQRRDRLVAVLKTLPDLPRALSRLVLGRGGPRDLGALRQAMVVAASVDALLEPMLLPPELAGCVQTIAALPKPLLHSLEAVLDDELPLSPRDGGFVRSGQNDTLDEARALRDESRRVIARLQARYQDETAVKSLKIRHNNILGYHIEVPAGQADALKGEAFIHRQTMANAMRFTTSELAELASRIANAAGHAVAIELALFEQLVAEATAQAEALQMAAQALGIIDVSSALAELAEGEGYCRPQVDDTLAFEITAGRHPVVEQALRRDAGDPFIANSCDLSPQTDAGAGSIWLLTGPNMGGKSTFLRQNALIALMAQAGSFVPAGSAHIGVVDRLFSRVGASDDLARGRSTFMVEMVETAAILNQAGERSLVILDEIGRGTSTFDGLSIAWAAVEYLHEQNRCRALFATHFHEMTALAAKLPRLHLATMRVKEHDSHVVFLHEVAMGAADRSYGVQVARLAGLPPAVVARAREVLALLERDGQSRKATAIADDLPLFAAPVKRAAPRHFPAKRPVEDALKDIHPDELTPRDALELVYRLKRLSVGDGEPG